MSQDEKIRKLPLWRGLLETILEDARPGKVYEAGYFEQELSCNRHTREFSLACHKIRMGLEERGLYLQGHAARSGTLVIIPVDRNIGTVKNRERSIHRIRKRNITLLSATPRELLSTRVKKLHEKLLMRIQIKALIEKRAGKIHRLLKEKAPKMLE